MNDKDIRAKDDNASSVPLVEELKPLDMIVPDNTKVEEVAQQVDTPKVDDVIQKVEPQIDASEEAAEQDIAEPSSELEESKVDSVKVADRCKWCVRIGIVLLAILTLGGIIWGYTQLSQKSKTTPEKLEVLVVSTPEPTPSPSPGEVSIVPKYAVWNGSGVTGAAGVLSDKLKVAGRDVSETKNAPELVTGNQIVVIPELESQKSLIETELEGMGIESATWKYDLPSDLEYNVRLILGK